MHLLRRNGEAKICLVTFVGKHIPPYAILSHTWGREELTFQELMDGSGQKKLGYKKIEFCAEQASRDGLDYFWVDTCCIDKSSSVELQEAINSMFRWYQEAKVCYVFLSDVARRRTGLHRKLKPLKDSKWFTRGWTLQELLAPSSVEFYDADWSFMGTRQTLAPAISKITGIGISYLCDHGADIHAVLRNASIAERMSWAAHRETTREEDVAYSLLGIFDINMPMLYGEGKNAFIRLQEEIIKRWDDQSLFAWQYAWSHPWRKIEWSFVQTGGVLAESPANFAGCGAIVPYKATRAGAAFFTSNKGLQITLPMCEEHALLECHRSDDPTAMIVLRLRRLYDNVFMRAIGEQTGTVDHRAWRQWKRRSIIILTTDQEAEDSEECALVVRSMPKGFEMLIEAAPGIETPTSSATVMVPMRDMKCGEAKTFKWTLKSPGMRPIVLGLTARKIYEEKDRHRWKWLSYKFSPQASDQTGATGPRHQRQFRNLLQGSTTWALPDGKVLYAQLDEQRIFGRSVLTIDLRRISVWSLEAFLAQTVGLVGSEARELLVRLISLLPSWTSDWFWQTLSGIRAELGRSFLPYFWFLIIVKGVNMASPYFHQESLSGFKAWMEASFQDFVNNGPTRLWSSAFILTVLQSLQAAHIKGLRDSWLTESETSTYTTLFLGMLPYLYKHSIGNPTQTDKNDYVFILIPQLFRGLSGLYRPVTLLGTFKPRYVGTAIGTEYPLSITLIGIVDAVLIPCLSTWVTWRLISNRWWQFRYLPF